MRTDSETGSENPTPISVEGQSGGRSHLPQELMDLVMLHQIAGRSIETRAEIKALESDITNFRLTNHKNNDAFDPGKLLKFKEYIEIARILSKKMFEKVIPEDGIPQIYNNKYVEIGERTAISTAEYVEKVRPILKYLPLSVEKNIVRDILQYSDPYVRAQAIDEMRPEDHDLDPNSRTSLIDAAVKLLREPGHYSDDPRAMATHILAKVYVAGYLELRKISEMKVNSPASYQDFVQEVGSVVRLRSFIPPPPLPGANLFKPDDRPMNVRIEELHGAIENLSVVTTVGPNEEVYRKHFRLGPDQPLDDFMDSEKLATVRYKDRLDAIRSELIPKMLGMAQKSLLNSGQDLSEFNAIRSKLIPEIPDNSRESQLNSGRELPDRDRTRSSRGV